MNQRIVMIVALLVFALPVFAQDESPTPDVPPTETVIPSETPAPTETTIPSETPAPTETPIPPPPPVDETPVDSGAIINALLVALVALVALGGVIVVTWGKWLYNSIPAIARPPAKDLITRVLDEAGKYVEGTPERTDDELFAIIRKFVHEVIDDELQPAVDQAVSAAAAQAARDVRYTAPPQA